MRFLSPSSVGIVLILLVAGCGGSESADESPGDSAAADPETEVPIVSASPTSNNAGSADISLSGEGVSVSGTVPAILCGGPYIMGEGMSYQARADDWQITIASEERLTGSVPLNAADGNIQVVATANGPGSQLVRGPNNEGTLTVSEDFRTAEADLELRNLGGGQTARLVATFACEEAGS